MKVVAPAEMARIESLAYTDGSRPEEFMENAGRGVALKADAFIHKHFLSKTITVLCGKGNNGGDAYVAAIHLRHMGHAVVVYQLEPPEKCSPLCKKNYLRFISEGGTVIEPNSPADFVFKHHGIIIDGMFGTGFHGATEGIYAFAIKEANQIGIPILAIDIPSGLNGQTGEALGAVINATETLYLGLPKTGFFLLEGWNKVGQFEKIDFGLDQKWIDDAKEDFILLTSKLVKPLKPHIKRNRHKYEAGVVVGLSGSSGMPGAAQLSSLAALRGGSGLVRLLHPDGMQAELANSPYELIRVSYTPKDYQVIEDALNAATAIYIGPGLGKSETMHQMLKNVMPLIRVPCVLDADALTIAAEEDLPFPENSVLTPHHGEMLRLFKQTQKEPFDLSWLKKCQSYAEEKKVTLVLKGAPTFIFHPNEPILVSIEGDPGMATAGCGDVLTGLIASFLSQGVQTRDAAVLAVFLHGKAGEKAAKHKSSYCLIASDIITYLPEAFFDLENT